MPSRSKSHSQFEHLSTSQLAKIRYELEGGKSQRQLAIKYGVKEQTIRLAAAGGALHNGSSS